MQHAQFFRPRFITLAVVSLGLMALGAVPASALEFSQSGTTARLTGSIRLGDGARFQEFMARPEAANIRVFQVQSPGGSIGNALEIARIIRRRGGTTVTDARQICESACTILFLAGTNRHYINTGGLQDRLGGARGGLGFHEGNNMNADGRGRQYSGTATASMINAYYELGASGAAQFATKAGFDSMYRLSGQTALSNGIATSLSPP